jgi:uncharacterized protein
MNGTKAAALLGGLVALGMVVGGWFVGDGLYRARADQRRVTVKGLAEREVRADLAVWPIVYSATADDLGVLQGRLDAAQRAIGVFLDGRGFAADERALSEPRITDQQAFQRSQPGDRYLAEQTVTVRSSRVDDVQRALRESGELVKAGVAMIRSYEYQTQFFYTQLDAVKPEMIAEATRDARRAAEQFAEDSGSRVGAIRTAQQGFFSIDDRDPFSPDWKRIRVVTTVEYFLVDD